MRIEAVLRQRNREAKRRRFKRRSLKLATVGKSAGLESFPVIIRNISAGGMLIESPEGAKGLRVGNHVSITLGLEGTAEGRVAWQRGVFFGCDFEQPVPLGTVSAALLKADAPSSAQVTDFEKESWVPSSDAKRADAVPQWKFQWVGFALAGMLWAIIFYVGSILAN